MSVWALLELQCACVKGEKASEIEDHTSITPVLQYADFLRPDTDQADKKHISVKQSASP